MEIQEVLYNSDHRVLHAQMEVQMKRPFVPGLKKPYIAPHRFFSSCLEELWEQDAGSSSMEKVQR
eukprot:10914872-Prorocentrum_lima.AAC.1